MKRIAIVGSSGFGKEIKTIIDDINEVSPTWKVIGFYDDSFVSETEIFDGISIKGNVDDLLKKVLEETAVVFGIADRNVVESIYTKLKGNSNINFPNIIHPTVKFYSGTNIGKGNVMAFGTFLSCDIEIGDFNFFNTYVAIGHDVTIENYNCLMPRAQISGSVKIGGHNFFGMNSSIVQSKTMGHNNIINAFTFLTKSIKNDRKYFGIPGKRIDN